MASFFDFLIHDRIRISCSPVYLHYPKLYIITANTDIFKKKNTYIVTKIITQGTYVCIHSNELFIEYYNY